MAGVKEISFKRGCYYEKECLVCETERIILFRSVYTQDETKLKNTNSFSRTIKYRVGCGRQSESRGPLLGLW